MRRAGLLALAAAAALVLPASSPAATVGVEEPATSSPPATESQARLTFTGAPDEANRLTVSVAREDAARAFELRKRNGRQVVVLP